MSVRLAVKNRTSRGKTYRYNMTFVCTLLFVSRTPVVIERIVSNGGDCRQSAVEDEERFDFLRPVLENLEERQAIYREEAKHRPRRGRKPQNDKKSSKTKNEANMGSTSANAEAASSSDSFVLDSTAIRTSGGVLAQAGLDSEESRRALLMMQEAVTGSSSAGGGGVKDDALDDDYDDC